MTTSPATTNSAEELRETIDRMTSSCVSDAERGEWFQSLPDRSSEFPWAEGNVATDLGLRIHVIDAERMICSMPVAGNEQHMGILHGGINAVLGETTGSFAAWVGAPEGWTALGLDIAMHHHRGVAEGRIWCVARRVSLTRSFASYQLCVYRDDGVVTSSGQHTCALRPIAATAEGARGTSR
ncbi:PaaI family thioesterase [Nanchangia anserum]|uniref:PaaI family thioesterase n=1 Tax=Nanchangia anserum TaxID=2692125 RepID=A0A8I0KQQ9_9ACTO|nr:PaaI family thioesterase [Nanchangia anserum]MBD3688702.1 PaaI family thioesterase [Nanchangia anserum]QOX82449.1 PaaI family thioesterase [Nanchangia anserum]